MGCSPAKLSCQICQVLASRLFLWMKQAWCQSRLAAKHRTSFPTVSYLERDERVLHNSMASGNYLQQYLTYLSGKRTVLWIISKGSPQISNVSLLEGKTYVFQLFQYSIAPSSTQKNQPAEAPLYPCGGFTSRYQDIYQDMSGAFGFSTKILMFDCLTVCFLSFFDRLSFSFSAMLGESNLLNLSQCRPGRKLADELRGNPVGHQGMTSSTPNQLCQVLFLDLEGTAIIHIYRCIV